jgi:hypothetical protein
LFGNNNQTLLLALRNGERLDAWQAQGISRENMELIRSFEYQSMSPQSAAAVFWYIRNALFFGQQLDHRSDAIPIAYEKLVENPREILQAICSCLNRTYLKKAPADVYAQSARKKPPNIDDRVTRLCEPMYDRLCRAAEVRWHELQLEAWVTPQIVTVHGAVG